MTTADFGGDVVTILRDHDVDYDMFSTIDEFQIDGPAGGLLIDIKIEKSSGSNVVAVK